jgi:protein CpxP
MQTTPSKRFSVSRDVSLKTYLTPYVKPYIQLSAMICIGLLCLSTAKAAPSNVTSNEVVVSAETSDHPGKRHDRHHRSGGRGDTMMWSGMSLKGLDLTDSQRTEIRKLMASIKPKEDDKAAMLAQKKAIDDLLAQPQFDATAARQLLEQQQQQRLELQLKALQVQHQIRALLTDEQRAKLAERQEKRRQKWAEQQAEKRAAKPSDNI